MPSPQLMQVHRPSRGIRPVLAASAAVGLIGLALATAGPASAAGAAPRAATGRMATVRVGHLSPDMPGADVYLTSFTGGTTVFLKDATYGQLSHYRQVQPGTYTFALRKHGAAPNGPVLKSWTVDAQPGYAYTAALVGVGSGHRGVVLHDNLTPPAKGHANVRFIQASSRAGTADVDAVHGPVIASNAAFGSSTQYAQIPAGTWPLRATGNGTSTDARVSVAAGSVTSVVLLDATGGRTRLTSVVDAAGAPAHGAPVGSVDAGGGGTAVHVVDRPGMPIAALGSLAGAAALLTAGAALSLRRRAARCPGSA